MVSWWVWNAVWFWAMWAVLLVVLGSLAWGSRQREVAFASAEPDEGDLAEQVGSLQRQIRLLEQRIVTLEQRER